MPEYRVFVRDLDNHILSAGFTFICENDHEALAKTEKLVDGLDLELWCQGGRYVARITATGQSDKEPTQVGQADPAALLTRRKHVQIERDYIRCATSVVTRQSTNSQDCHSNHAGNGRRTFITKAAKRCIEGGGSLRDVQQLADHSSLAMTQRYIEGSSDAKRRIVDLIS